MEQSQQSRRIALQQKYIGTWTLVEPFKTLVETVEPLSFGIFLPVAGTHQCVCRGSRAIVGLSSKGFRMVWGLSQFT